MSFSIETKNRGNVSEFGFWGSDTTRIMLGELPSIPIGQFCRYATEAIVASLPLASVEQREAMKRMITFAVQRNESKVIRATTNPLDFPRHHPIDVTSTEQVSDVLQVETYRAPQGFFEELREASEKGDEDRTEQLIDEWYLGMNSSKGNTVEYSENPFEVKPTVIVIRKMYEVDFDEFALFAIHYITGGLVGWDSRGIPDYAHESLQTLQQAILEED